MASDGEYISCLPGQRSGDACIERPFALVGDIGSNLPLVVLGTRVVIQQDHPSCTIKVVTVSTAKTKEKIIKPQRASA